MTKTISTIEELASVNDEDINEDGVDFKAIVVELIDHMMRSITTMELLVGLGMLAEDHPGIEGAKHVFGDQLTIILGAFGLDVAPLVDSLLKGVEDEGDDVPKSVALKAA